MNAEQMIVDRILEEMKKGVVPWHRPWVGVVDGPVSHATGDAYSLLNQMMLGGVKSEFITFKQAIAEGGAPKKGSHGRHITFWKRLRIVEGQDEDGKEVARTIPFLRYYTVFDIADCDGIAPRWADREVIEHEPSAEGEAIVRGYFGQANAPKLQRDEASNRAFYSPTLDAVTVPRMDQFKSLAEYYSTLFHEMTHSTGHESRLDRFQAGDRYGSEGYSREELVAEIAAASLVHRIGLETPESFSNSASYVEGWSRAIKNDPRMFVTACARAEKAVRWILEGAPEDGEPMRTTEKPAQKPETAPEAALALPEGRPVQMMLF